MLFTHKIFQNRLDREGNNYDNSVAMLNPSYNEILVYDICFEYTTREVIYTIYISIFWQAQFAKATEQDMLDTLILFIHTGASTRISFLHYRATAKIYENKVGLSRNTSI